VTRAAECVQSAWRKRRAATTGACYPELRNTLAALPVCPELGVGLEAALDQVGELVLPASVGVGHPLYAAHLHSVPAIPALAAEVIISATNQSLDSFDQAPTATALERCVIDWMTDSFGFGPGGDGVFTGGATKSNLMGLMLARDSYAKARLDHDVSRDGVPQGARMRILCSELAHFSVDRAAAILGLGENAVVRLPADESGTLRPETLRAAIEAELGAGRRPIAVVLTAGTTDLGSIDPIAENIEVAASHSLWTHVDAAAGGAYVLSDSQRALLQGIERADSVAVDFHKLLFQPISCGVFLVKSAASLAPLRRRIPYLDPNDGGLEAGPNLVAKSLDTTRRFDALKVWVTLRALGRAQIGRLLDASIATARYAAEAIRARRSLELLLPPATHTIVMRWSPRERRLRAALIDSVNRQLPYRLWTRGGPVVGGAVYRGMTCVKLTLTNPCCAPRDIDAILAELEHEAEALSAALQAAELAERKAQALSVTRVRASDPRFTSALRDEFHVFGVGNRYASAEDIAAGRMLPYARYDATSEFYLAHDARGELAGITRLIRCDDKAGLDSFSTLVDGRSYSARGEPARSYLDPAWLQTFQRLPPSSIAELATQAIAARYRRFRAIDALWHAMYGACRAEGVEFWTVALVVPLFQFYKALLPNALQAIGSVMPDYIGADSIPAVLRLAHPEVEAYLRVSAAGQEKEVSDESNLSKEIDRPGGSGGAVAVGDVSGWD
jgi:L-2,4-diaminobutyrate decarboxylase